MATTNSLGGEKGTLLLGGEKGTLLLLTYSFGWIPCSAMPRTARAIEAGLIYHVLNRGNGRLSLFRTPEDFDAFERILAEGLERYPVDLFTWCLMGNHWHLVVRPGTDGALAGLMGWVGVTHVRRHHAHYRTSGGGHLYQGRYKSFPVQADGHFLTLCRYVEANPLRAKLVRRAEDWRWSGLARREGRAGRGGSVGREGSVGRGGSAGRAGGVIVPSDWPMDRPRNWGALVNEPIAPRQADQICTSIRRERPLGTDAWVSTIAKRLKLEWTLRDRGRPRKDVKGEKE